MMGRLYYIEMPTWQQSSIMYTCSSFTPKVQSKFILSYKNKVYVGHLFELHPLEWKKVSRFLFYGPTQVKEINLGHAKN